VSETAADPAIPADVHPDVARDLDAVLLTAEQIHERLGEIAAEVDADYEGRDPADPDPAVHRPAGPPRLCRLSR